MAVTAVASFLAGLLAFFSPCVLPMIPALLGVVTRNAGVHGTGAALTDGRSAGRWRSFGLTALFVAGFTIAFTIIGFLIGAVGSSATFIAWEGWLRRVGGLFIIAFGLLMLRLIDLGFLARDLRFHGRFQRLGPGAGTLALGAAFGVGWTPCVGPILASILVLAGLEASAVQGAWLLAFFSLGLAIPFLLFGLAADRGAAFLKKYGRASRTVEVAGGLFLILLGIAVFTGTVNRVLLWVS